MVDRKVPSLIIVGAQKCGSSSLAHYINQHPDCFLSEPKEPTYFSRLSTLGDSKIYEECFAKSRGEQVLFEASTGYLFEPYAAQRIRDELGSIKIIMILRNPIERTISAYLHLRKRFHEARPLKNIIEGLPENMDECCFEENRRAVLAASERKVELSSYASRYDDFLWPFRYVSNSQYSKGILRYQRLFGRENVFIVLLEDLEKNPTVVMERVFNYLSLPTCYSDQFTKRLNETSMPTKLNFTYYLKHGGWREAFIRRLSSVHDVREALSGKKGRGKEEAFVEEGVRDNLAAIFLSHIEEVSELCQQDLGTVWNL